MTAVMMTIAVGIDVAKLYSNMMCLQALKGLENIISSPVS